MFLVPSRPARTGDTDSLSTRAPEAVLTARNQERKAILDAWLKERRQRKNKHWNDAFMALIRILAERSETDHPQAAE